MFVSNKGFALRFLPRLSGFNRIRSFLAVTCVCAAGKEMQFSLGRWRISLACDGLSLEKESIASRA